MARVRLQHVLVLALAITSAPTVAFADDGGDRVAFGGDALVAAGETVQSVAAFGGDAVIDGRVDGDVVSFGGNVELGPLADVRGSVASLGGRVESEPGARFHVDGDGPITHHLTHASHSRSGLGAWLEDALRQVVAHGLLFLLALLLMGLAPERLGAMQVAIVRDPVRTASIGFAGYIASIVLIVLLAITILGIPAAVALAILMPIATYIGLAAAASVMGAALPIERLRDRPARRLAAGVLVLFVASLVPVLGTLVVAVASCLGYGALIRTRFRPTLPPDLAETRATVEDGPYRTSAA